MSCEPDSYINSPKGKTGEVAESTPGSESPSNDGSIATSLAAGANDPTSEESASELELLQETRQSWKELLAVSPSDGDARYVISKEYLEHAMTLEVASLTQLHSRLGNITCSALVNENGALFPEDSEPVPSTHISPELFRELVNTFGLEGTPVIRNIIEEPESSFVLERFPPYFIVHTLSDLGTARVPAHHDRTLRNGQCFSLSQTKTFRDLVSTIQTCVYRGRKAELRVWFVSSENIAELPFVVPVSMFIKDISETKVVEPNVMDLSLRSQGIRSSTIHLVVELQNKLSKDFPLDQFINRQGSRAGSDSNLGGDLGLSNLGNTCYMNSALQCLVHIPEVNQYFFYDLYVQELNKENPLGNNGEVAISFSSLVHKLFDAKSATSVTPREFKYTIGRYSSMFHGYQQQDTQEFLSWLLDALHEDLNRIHKKPYTEKPELKDEDVGNMDAITQLASDCWDLYKKRNDSIIVDLFTGLYQSTLVCPVCDKQSITFDPFNDFTLPLPVSKKWYHTFTIVDLSFGSDTSKLFQLEVELSKTSNINDLKTYLSKFLKVDPSYLFLFEIFRNYFYKDFQTGDSVNKFIPISELISDDDNVIVYIIPHDSTRDIIVPIVNIVQDADESYSMKEPFGIPLFIVCDRQSDIYSFGSIRAKAEQAVTMLSTKDLEEDYSRIKKFGDSKYFSSDDFPLLRKAGHETKDEKMADNSSEGELDGYDSDVSLAHPSVSGSFGFEMKVYEGSSRESRHQRFQKYGQMKSSETDSNVIHIPHGRPHFKNLQTLAAKLPELKRNFYHYPDLVSRSEAEASQNTDSESQKYYAEAQENGFEVVSSGNLDLPQKSVGSTSPVDRQSDSTLSDAEESDCGSNWVDVEPLLSSEDKIPGTESDASKAPDSDKHENSPHDSNFGVVADSNKRPQLLDTNTLLVLEWNPEVYNQYFQLRENQTWQSPPKIPNKKLEESKKQWNSKQASTISLYDCLKSFSVPEVLGDQDLWYCPKCKDHRRATKTIQLWSTGDILTIHLKRFQSARRFSDKINSVVDFPIEGLDMSDYVNSPTKDEDLIYDLIAVDNHFGGLGGGHYTASALNFRDKKWYYFNDSRVTPIEDPKECITSAAYLLFYKKRSSNKFAGGANVESLLEKGRAAYDQRLNQRQISIQHISKQLSDYHEQLSGLSESPENESALEKQGSTYLDDQEEDLYDDIPEAPVSNGSNKKSRSPMSEQTIKFEFENQRKQRLISKTSDSPRGVNINLGYSSSASNLASPEGSSSSEEDVIFD